MSRRNGLRLQRLIAVLRGQKTLDDYRDAGADIAADVLANGLLININDCFLVTIEQSVVFGPDVRILAHDASLRPELGYTRMAPVVVGKGSFVGAGTLILCGASIGAGSIIAAGSVVVGSLEGGQVYGGIPAKRIASKEEVLDRWRRDMSSSPSYPRGWKARLSDESTRKRIRDEVRSAGVGWFF